MAAAARRNSHQISLYLLLFLSLLPDIGSCRTLTISQVFQILCKKHQISLKLHYNSMFFDIYRSAPQFFKFAISPPNYFKSYWKFSAMFYAVFGHFHCTSFDSGDSIWWLKTLIGPCLVVVDWFGLLFSLVLLDFNSIITDGVLQHLFSMFLGKNPMILLWAFVPHFALLVVNYFYLGQYCGYRCSCCK